jgi:hypothetical protein
MNTIQCRNFGLPGLTASCVEAVDTFGQKSAHAILKIPPSFYAAEPRRPKIQINQFEAQ